MRAGPEWALCEETAVRPLRPFRKLLPVIHPRADVVPVREEKQLCTTQAGSS